MPRRDSESKRKNSYFAELNEIDQSVSEDEDDKAKEVEEEEELYGWDLFRYFPSKPKTGSSADTKLYEATLQVIKFITYLIIFIFVLGGGIFAKGTILFATAQLERKNPQSYCDYNEPEGRPGVRQLVATIPEEGRIMWYWCILVAFCVPEVFSLIEAIYNFLFKKWKFPNPFDLIFVYLLEGLHATGIVTLFLICLPEFSSIEAASICSFTCFIPTLLGLLSRNRQEHGAAGKLVTIIVGDIIVLVAQVGSIIFLSFLSDISNTARIMLPVALILSSCRWWPNYVSPNSQIGFIRMLARLKERMEQTRGIVQGITALWRMLVFFIISIGIITWKGIDVQNYFQYSLGNFEYNVTLSEVSQDNTTANDTAIITVNSWEMIVVLVIHIFTAYITYSTGKFASRTLMQRFGFALPACLTVPSTVITIAALSLIRINDSCSLHGFLPDYLLFAGPKSFVSVTQFLAQWQYWIWIFGMISQAWTTIHIWTPHCERLASADRLFAVPSYDSLIIDQSLMLNRRNDDAPDDSTKSEEIYAEDSSTKYNEHLSENLSITVRPSDRVTRIYACATMWHEVDEEMMQFIGSILRLDLCQAAMRFTQKRYSIQITDYFELETHIFFDDAFECMHGCEKACKHDENETRVNSYVKSLIEIIKTSVERLGIHAYPPMKYPAPYGGRLEWSLPGKTSLIVHLKDKNKIRHRKRWSQVMYMYYLLGYHLIDRPIHINRKAVIAENTYILTLDGDIDFMPSAVKVLLHLMKKDKTLGAACGRIHPVGSGPMVWFQKFEYAIGHWLQKSTEHTIGSVLCSPGCFSLFRAKALMEDNVMRKYATRSTEARHYVQYDQGEDRWLCTLILQSGYRVEYSAASDSYTHAPETFNEFYNQRRRWIPSTMANIFDLLDTANETRKNNENISWLYIVYQWVLMGSTILGPGTIFLMLVGAFVAAFKIGNWPSFYYNLIPIALFVVVCCFCKARTQLFVAAIVSAFYGLVMIVVLVGIMLQIADDGWVAPSTILFFVVAGQLMIAGLLHPKEWSCLACGIIYYVTVPSMYLVLIIFSLFNVNNVTWGTRESKENIEADPNVKVKPAESKTLTSKLYSATKKSAMDFSFAGLFRCMLCTEGQPSEEVHKLDQIAESLGEITSRLDALEKYAGGSVESLAKNNNDNDEVPREKSPKLNDDNGYTEEIDMNDQHMDANSECMSEEQEDTKLGNFLVSPYWVQDPDIQQGGIEFLSHEEEVFWKRLIAKYLYPLDEDKKQLEKTAEALKYLRNENLFKFFMLNALFVLIVFLMQLKKDTLHVEWPLGAIYNISYRNETMEVHIGKDYLELEPIGCLFIAGFVLILSIQFVAMLIHRYDTFLHLLSNTNISINCCVKSTDVTGEVLVENHVKDIVEGLQRLAEDNANPVAPGRLSVAISPKKRNTVHALIENHDKRTKMPVNFDAVFRQNLQGPSDNPRLTSTGISQSVLKAFERRRTTLVAKHRKSLYQRNNSDAIYESADNLRGNKKFNHISTPPTESNYTYDNKAFVADEVDEGENGILAPRRSQVTFENV